MTGPKPTAPIPKYEPGTDLALRERLRGTSATPTVIAAGENTNRISVAGIEGMIDRRKANIAARLVDTDPDRALRIIRNWLIEE